MSHLTGDKWLVAMLLYGGGLRLLEALRLRVKDLDFERTEITVREGKGDKDRVTTMPRAVVHSLQKHMQRVQETETVYHARRGVTGKQLQTRIQLRELPVSVIRSKSAVYK